MSCFFILHLPHKDLSGGEQSMFGSEVTKAISPFLPTPIAIFSVLLPFFPSSLPTPPLSSPVPKIIHVSS
uniref:Alternative protein IDS n=1 Tax=Homo sapiens TaxID=9606 RepID=L8E9D7_HUMAN|nr:alternative protein IDS [Homo sapiens]